MVVSGGEADAREMHELVMGAELCVEREGAMEGWVDGVGEQAVRLGVPEEAGDELRAFVDLLASDGPRAGAGVVDEELVEGSLVTDACGRLVGRVSKLGTEDENVRVSFADGTRAWVRCGDNAEDAAPLALEDASAEDLQSASPEGRRRKKSPTGGPVAGSNSGGIGHCAPCAAIGQYPVVNTSALRSTCCSPDLYSSHCGDRRYFSIVA